MFRPFNRIFPCAVSLLALLLSLGCEETTTSSYQEPVSVDWHTTLPNLLTGSDNYFPIRAEVKGMPAADIDSVLASISNDAGQDVAQFSLFDDANFYEHNTPDTIFCSKFSGDVIANDGIFSRRINALFAGASPGSYNFQVTVWHGEGSIKSPLDTVIVAQSVPPELSGLIFPDTLSSGFSPQQISLQVIDPDDPGVDSVTAVYMKLYSPESAFLDSIALETLGSNRYGTTLQADLAVARPSGDYIFAFRALDTFETMSDSLGKSVYMENLAPYLNDSVLPDSIPRPTLEDTTFALAVKCWDDQTVADILTVTIQAQKPDLTWGSVIELFDDGNISAYGDTLAGDSVYTRIVSISPSNDLGLYLFHFKGEDKAGNQSEIVDSLWVVP